MPRDGAQRTSRPSSPFVGDAMRALLESGDVRIARGDETRVISRAHEDAVAKPPPREPARAAARTPEPDAPATHSSAPPGPHVDKALWAVLAVGLFAIAGWMLLHAY